MPGIPVALLISANGVLLARVLADQLREDLREAGLGNGGHSFDVAIEGLSSRARHVIAVQRETDGTHLEGSPILLEPIEAFDAAFRSHCAAILADAPDESALRERLSFLEGQTEALLALQAQQQSRSRERAGARLRRGQPEAEALPSLPSALSLGPHSSGLRPRALVVDEWMPSPSRDAGSNAILSHMRALQALGFEVVFASADMAADANGVLGDAGIVCCHAPWPGSVEELLRRQAGGFDLVYLHRASVAVRYLGLVRHHQPKARLVYSVADLHHLRLARQAEIERRPELGDLARRFQRAELGAAAAADAVITHSAFEARLLSEHVSAARVHVVPWATALRPTAVPFAERAGVAFICHYGHAPNLDAAQWLVDEIMPRVHATRPGIVCLLAGSNMPDALRTPRPDIVAIGQVGSLAEIFDRVRLTVAPLAFGAGIKGKVIESLAAGVPCVCTPVATEGLDLPAPLRALISADVAELAAAIIRLHDDEALNGNCRDAGLAYAGVAFSEARTLAGMQRVVGMPCARQNPAQDRPLN